MKVKCILCDGKQEINDQSIEAKKNS
ncbi:DUF2197 domain-containing protein [Brochothrix campestris]|uniref:Uncharacterized protein n=1 Tax=Brochothrix campestris FSL F6-1037 TaxID=1265861 RepID=W7D8G2_9LIST|nr:hypothetical protein BCAMP_02725 [Brochothrix campestris FSL F6-1037]